jgi:hypothetical protein
MNCDWGHDDCKKFPDSCWMCITTDKYYVPRKARSTGMAKRQARPSGRKGSNFEYSNHVSNKDLLSGATSNMTINSGAGFVKGDEEIKGIINIMEELKTSSQLTTRGKKTISIQKEWLDKLDTEAKAAHKEFWYLKFAFGDHEKDSYITLSADMIMGMVYTMVEDRKAKRIAELRQQATEVKVKQLEAEVEHLKIMLELTNEQVRGET